jgi:hypothetical protein
MKTKIIICIVLIATSSIWSACNCDNVQNKLMKLNPRQVAFFAEFPNGYSTLSLKSNFGQTASYSVKNYFYEQQGPNLKNGVCPVYRMYETREVNYSTYASSLSESINFRMSAENQPGTFEIRLNQYEPLYSYGYIKVDLHNPNLFIEGGFDNAEPFKNGFIEIGDTTINGRNYNDIYALKIKKRPTALSVELKEMYLSFSKGIVALKRVNNVIWMAE